jgi:alpha-L-arabinofuranosidase
MRNKIRLYDYLRGCVLFCLAALAFGGTLTNAQQPVTLTVHVNQPGAKIDQIFYGLMTEEINYSYDGGLYAELIRNRIFQDRPIARGGRGGGVPANPAVAKNPNLVNWWLVADNGAGGEIDIDTNDPVNARALKNSLRLDIKSVAAGQRVGVANDGYWGVQVKPNTAYTASFYAKAGQGFKGSLKVAIEGNNGAVYASGQVTKITNAWRKYVVKIKTGKVQPTADARFVLSVTSPGSIWFSFVSLFPPTYKNRANGMRIDLMEKLADMKPSFLRFPGGNYLEGNDFANRFNWKATIGPLEERVGHMSPWSYRSTDGVGLLEFLTWCEDLNMEPLLGVYAGLHLDQGRTTITGDALKPFVQEALEEIEYITGDKSTTWGARRARDGHPAPFKLRYVEIGNEDWLNNGLRDYAGRFTMFYDAIKAKYPDLKIISTMRSRDRYNHGRTPDLLDDHFYVNIATSLTQAHYYDKYDRAATKIFVGEWATNNPGSGDTGHMGFALGDAAWLTGLERNADVIVMNAYAPLLVNVNPGGRQWQVNLIGYDALTSFGSPAYYVQKMFANNRGDVVLPAKFDPLPQLTATEIPQAPGQSPGGGRGPTGSFDGLYASATRETVTGDIILKLVNVQAVPQPLNINLQGIEKVARNAVGEVLEGKVGDMNSIAEPLKVAPKPIAITDAGVVGFSRELPAHSVTVIRLKTRFAPPVLAKEITGKITNITSFSMMGRPLYALGRVYIEGVEITIPAVAQLFKMQNGKKVKANFEDFKVGQTVKASIDIPERKEWGATAKIVIIMPSTDANP